jgi:hypothetical protein
VIAPFGAHRSFKEKDLIGASRRSILRHDALRAAPFAFPVLLTPKILAVCDESSARHRQGVDLLDPATESLPAKINAATDDAATGCDR